MRLQNNKNLNQTKKVEGSLGRALCLMDTVISCENQWFNAANDAQFCSTVFIKT